VTRNEGQVSLISAGDFGRRPITARMAPRYEAALCVLNDIAHGDGTAPPEVAARLSELKGMANRCLRRDRVDWLSVWRLLGSADRDRLNDLADLAQRTRQAVTSDVPGLRAALADDAAFSHWADALAQARYELRRRPDAEPELEPEPEPGTAPEAITAPPTEPGKTHEQKDTNPMDTAAPLDTSTAPSDGRAAWGEALAREMAIAAQTDRDCNTHEAVRFELKAALLRAGLRPSDSPVADVILDGRNGLVRYEVLGAGRSGYADLRAGAVRLMELDHIEPRPADSRYLVLSEPPTEDWAPDAVREVFGVHVVWRTTGGWDGRDTRTALHLTD
jgi:hypothetical protein